MNSDKQSSEPPLVEAAVPDNMVPDIIITGMSEDDEEEDVAVMEETSSSAIETPTPVTTYNAIEGVEELDYDMDEPDDKLVDNSGENEPETEDEVEEEDDRKPVEDTHTRGLAAAVRLNEVLQATTSETTLKRKHAAVAMEQMNLLTFLRVLSATVNELYFLPEGRLEIPSVINFLNNLDHFRSNEYIPSKIAKKTMDEDAVDDNCDRIPFAQASENKRRDTYFKVMEILFDYIDERGINLMFQREYLKYFLATYKRIITVNDFVDTNRMSKFKKQKSSAPLNNGAILIEYFKLPEMFSTNLNRCEKSDIEALRFIITNNIELSSKIYNALHQFKPPVYRYIEEAKETIRPDYVRIPITNFKRAIFIVTKKVILMYDHHDRQLKMPPVCVEREISWSALKNMPYKLLVLDVLMSTKLKIIDIMGDDNLPDDYLKRLEEAEKFFKIKTVQAMITNAATENSYVQKLKFGYGDAYVHHKPCQIVGVVGICDKQALVVYKHGDTQSLIFKSKLPISGPATFQLCTVTGKRYESGLKTKLSISFQNKTYEILDLPDKPLLLYTKMLALELKDNNKLGASVDEGEIADVSEFKQTSAKDLGTSFNLADLKDQESMRVCIDKLMKTPQADKFVQMLVDKYKQIRCDITLNY